MGKETISSQELSRLHARQLDADPPRPVGLRQVRQARRRLQRRLARLADPQDPAHRRASTTSRCSAPATSARRSPPRTSSPTTASASWRSSTPTRRKVGDEGRRRDGAPRSTTCAQVVEEEDIVVGVLAVPDRGGPGARRRARRRRREDHLQLLRGAAAGAAGGDGPHLEPRRRPALRAVLLPDLSPPGDRHDIDLDRARETFEASTDFTVGIEEEFAHPRPRDARPRRRASRSCATRGRRRPGAGATSIAGELISSEIEIRSGRGEDLADALARQRERAPAAVRARRARTASRSARPARTRWADYREQQIIDTEHYRRVEDGPAVRRLAQQHVLAARPRRRPRRRPRGRASATACARCCRCCWRSRANSPFLDGRDSRPALGAHADASRKSFPRCGVPDAFGGWAAYARVRRLPACAPNSIVEYTQVWWSVRPHFTLRHRRGAHLRRADDRRRSPRRWPALIVACVAQAARDDRRGRAVRRPAARA